MNPGKQSVTTYDRYISWEKLQQAAHQTGAQGWRGSVSGKGCSKHNEELPDHSNVTEPSTISLGRFQVQEPPN